MKIEQQHLDELEQHHGRGMVIVISIGDDDFALRRPDASEVGYALTSKELGQDNYLENLALGCVLTPDAPRAGAAAKVVDGKPQERYAGLQPEEKAALLAAKARLETVWADAQELRDSLPGVFAGSIGGNPLVQSCEHIGGGRYEIKVSCNPNVADFIEPWQFAVTARKPTSAHYDQNRRLNATGSEGDSQRYLWGALVDSPNRDEIARLYPFAVIAVGAVLSGLGVDGRSVRVKKFQRGPAAEPGTSGEQLPAVTSA